jgi:hypothetical protein
MIQLPIPGSATLEELRLTCGRTENLEICKLVQLSKMQVVADKRSNLASFDEVDIEGELPDLIFVEITEGANTPSIIAEHMAAGKSFLFQAAIFVENKETEVAVFR